MVCKSFFKRIFCKSDICLGKSICSFVLNSDCDLFYGGRKYLKGKSTKDLGLSRISENSIYVSESLSPRNKEIFNDCLKFRRDIISSLNAWLLLALPTLDLICPRELRARLNISSMLPFEWVLAFEWDWNLINISCWIFYTMLDYSNQQGWVNYQFFLYNWLLYSIIYHMPFAATFELWYIKLAIAGFYVSIIQHRFVIPL